jgi:hypothetical protein
VLAATAGIAHLDGKSTSCGYVRVDAGNGFQTTYIHMTQALVSDGAPIYRGQQLGVTDKNVSCFGRADAYHTHFSAWFVPSTGTWCFGCTQYGVDWGGLHGGAGGWQEQIGNYLWTDGSQEYAGCATQVTTGQQTCWQNLLSQSIYNDGTVAGSACSAGNIGPVNGAHTVAAVATDSNSQAHLFVSGIDGDVWHQQYSNGNTNWNCLHAGAIEGSVAAVQYGTGTNIILVVRWADDSVHWATYDGTSNCCTWNNLGTGIGASDPVVAVFNNQVHAVVAARDGTVWDATYGGTWSGWSQIGTSAINGKPSIAVSNDGRLIFAGRRQLDNHLIWAYEPGGTTGAWPEITSWLVGASNPSMSLDGSRLMLAVYAGNSEVWDNYYTNGGWTTWSSLGGRLLGNPAAFTYQGQSLIFHVFVHGSSGPPPDALWDWTGSWYADQGVVLSNDPVATQISTNFDVFVRASDGSLHVYYSGTSSWASQGGQLR